MERPYPQVFSVKMTDLLGSFTSYLKFNVKFYDRVSALKKTLALNGRIDENEYLDYFFFFAYTMPWLSLFYDFDTLVS